MDSIVKKRNVPRDRRAPLLELKRHLLRRYLASSSRGGALNSDTLFRFVLCENVLFDVCMSRVGIGKGFPLRALGKKSEILNGFKLVL